MNNYDGVMEEWALKLAGAYIRQFHLKAYRDDIQQELAIKILGLKRDKPELAGGDEIAAIKTTIHDYIVDFIKYLDIRKGKSIHEEDTLYDPWRLIELKLDLADAMGRMRAQDRAICQLLLNGYTFREIARILGISQKTIANAKRRIRRIFRKMELEGYIE